METAAAHTTTYAVLLQNLAFYTLASFSVLSAAGMLLVRNLIHSAYLLVLTFLSVAGTFFLLNAEFLGVAQILIYASAVAIMMIFGLMLTNKPAAPMPNHGILFRYIAMAIGIGIFSYACRLALIAPWVTSTPVLVDTPVVIGRAFFNEFLLPFEVAAVLLLMALVGALSVARKEA
ncbi:MAG: NADH-quinone oxidoreductase subunit J [Candidatus Sericytochromatia bacterium]|nr:NADH-quinone oxidoreductase subunit J [Candidatus Sericytochromatia bacterium]